MSFIKRSFSGLYARIDQMVGEIENHDALIQAAIREQKQKLSSAKVQLRRLSENEKKTREQLAQATANAKLWAQRAVNEAQSNEQQALLCLQRREKTQQQAQRLETMCLEYQNGIARMRQDIGQCEQDLQTMTQKHQLLKARQTTADAMSMIERGTSLDTQELDTSFDRWETRIAQNEFGTESYSDTDFLEQEYLEAEQAERLRQELASLVNSSQSTSTPGNTQSTQPESDKENKS